MPHKIQIHFTKKSIKSASTSQNVNRISNLKVKISIKGEKKPKQGTDFSGLPVKLAFSTLTFHNKDIIQKKIAFLFYFFFCCCCSYEVHCVEKWNTDYASKQMKKKVEQYE